MYWFSCFSRSLKTVVDRCSLLQLKNFDRAKPAFATLTVVDHLDPCAHQRIEQGLVRPSLYGTWFIDDGEINEFDKVKQLYYLIDKYYKTHKDVQFYADRLKVSASNLNKISVSSTGKSVYANVK